MVDKIHFKFEDFVLIMKYLYAQIFAPALFAIPTKILIESKSDHKQIFSNIYGVREEEPQFQILNSIFIGKYMKKVVFKSFMMIMMSALNTLAGKGWKERGDAKREY